MTTGALIFAFNNEQTDYVTMASWSAQRIRRHLDIPVAVVTDCTDKSRTQGFDQVIVSAPVTGGTRYFEDYDATVSWHNAGRVDAYALSPWDRTLVVDADFVVCSNQLRGIIDADQDFMCHRLAMNMSTGDELDGLNCFGRAKMPMHWATVMMFRRSNTAGYVFDSMNMIRDNWQHYRDLYAIDRSTYRNDFALSIALGIVNGHTTHAADIPWPLMNVMPQDTIKQVDQDCFEIMFRENSGAMRTVSWSGFDFHAMGKSHLEKIIEAS